VIQRCTVHTQLCCNALQDCHPAAASLLQHPPSLMNWQRRLLRQINPAPCKTTTTGLMHLLAVSPISLYAVFYYPNPPPFMMLRHPPSLMNWQRRLLKEGMPTSRFSRSVSSAELSGCVWSLSHVGGWYSGS
jgi:hypothetical protein